MELVPVLDLPKDQAMAAFQHYRSKYHGETLSPEILEQVYGKIGGRLGFLNRVARAPDMMHACSTICQAEKTWFLNKCWILGEEMDDDVMDQQKYSVRLLLISSKPFLLTGLVRRHGPSQSPC